MKALLVLDVSNSELKEAEQIRHRRDEMYGNIYREEPTDMREVGDLGEIKFSSWLSCLGISHRWIKNAIDAAGNADFVIAGQRIGVKTVKRKGPMRLIYTQQITACHAHEPVAHFFFLSYEFPIRRMWLIGGCSKKFFLDHAKYYAAGEKVHDHYTVREGHEIYNIKIELLTEPAEWIQQFME
jgi:hypothetical protein